MENGDRGCRRGVEGFDTWFQGDAKAQRSGVEQGFRQTPTFTSDGDDSSGGETLNRSNGKTVGAGPDVGGHDRAAQTE